MAPVNGSWRSIGCNNPPNSAQFCNETQKCLERNPVTIESIHKNALDQRAAPAFDPHGGNFLFKNNLSQSHSQANARALSVQTRYQA